MSAASHLLLRLAKHISPGRRVDWVKAMQAELAYIPPQQCLPFAIGCLIATAHERAMHMFKSGLSVAKFICLAATLVLAGFGILNALRLGQQDPALGIAFGALALAWGSAFVATVMKNWQALVLVAVVGLALSSVMGLTTMLVLPAVQQSSNLIWALFIEGLVLFGAMLAAAQFFKREQMKSTV